jgi:hypothetical protein
MGPLGKNHLIWRLVGISPRNIFPLKKLVVFLDIRTWTKCWRAYHTVIPPWWNPVLPKTPRACQNHEKQLETEEWKISVSGCFSWFWLARGVFHASGSTGNHHATRKGESARVLIRSVPRLDIAVRITDKSYYSYFSFQRFNNFHGFPYRRVPYKVYFDGITTIFLTYKIMEISSYFR